MAGLCFIAAFLFIMAVSLGAVRVLMQEILCVFSGMEADVRFHIIIYNIRLP